MNKIVRSLLMRALEVIKKDEEEVEVPFNELSNKKKIEYIKTILEKMREANDKLEQTIKNVLNNNSFIFSRFGLDKSARRLKDQIIQIVSYNADAIEKILNILEQS